MMTRNREAVDGGSVVAVTVAAAAAVGRREGKKGGQGNGGRWGSKQSECSGRRIHRRRAES